MSLARRSWPLRRNISLAASLGGFAGHTYWGNWGWVVFWAIWGALILFADWDQKRRATAER